MSRLLAALGLVAAVIAVGAVVMHAGGDDDPRPRSARLLPGARVDDGYPVPVRQARLTRERGTHASALLLVPPGERGPMPAVIYLHGKGASSRDFLFEAAHMAARGTVVLSLDDANVGRPAVAGDALQRLRADRRRRQRTVADVRRAIDALAARPDVDPDRIAFVGFSQGGSTGALLAAREPRLAALVFIAAGGDPGGWILGPSPLAGTAAARALRAAIDPAAAVARDRTDRPRLVQYGTRDDVVALRDLAAFARSVPRPRVVQRFRAGHPLNLRAMNERLDWLTARLEVAGPPVPGAPTSPPLRERRTRAAAS